MEIFHFNFISLLFYNSDLLSQFATILAQTFNNVDIIKDMAEAWYNFVETGQCWALLIGVIVGYGFKGLTNY